MNVPRFEGVDVTVKTKADNVDIRKLLENLVPKAKSQMVDFSNQFKGKNDSDTCRKIFDFLRTLQYKADKSEQIIKLPSALLRKKVGDCKSFSLLTAAILENLNIPYTFVYASYNSNPIPHHVYVVTQAGCIIDAVYGKFNQEKKPIYKYKKNMNVRYMAGMNDCNCSNCSQMGKIGDGKAKAKIKTATKKVVKKTFAAAKTVGFAAGRGLFLVLIKNNIDGLATKLSQGNVQNLQNLWAKVGGDKAKVIAALKTGASKKEKKMGFLAKLKKAIGNRPIKGLGATGSGADAAIISVCTAAGTAIGGTPQGTTAGASLGGVIVGLLPVVMESLKKVPATDTGDAPIVSIPNVDTESELQTETAKESITDEVTEKPDEVTEKPDEVTKKPDEANKKSAFSNPLILVGLAAVGVYLAFGMKRGNAINK